LSRWRRWRRRSLRGCRAGCHQSCQDQKKRLSLHGEQMLPRYRCSLLAEKPTGVFGLPALRIRFPWWPRSGQPSEPRRTSGVPGVTGTGDCARLAARVKSAAPLPLIRRRRGARSLDDHPDADAGIVDVPGFRQVVDAFAGEGGHYPSKRAETPRANYQSLGAGNDHGTLPVADVDK
jgi:hypothetical protein